MDDERQTRELVTARSGGRCEVCGGLATDMAHRVGRGVGGLWCPSNMLHLCRECHQGCHGNPGRAYDEGVMLRAHQHPGEHPALVIPTQGAHLERVWCHVGDMRLTPVDSVREARLHGPAW